MQRNKHLHVLNAAARETIESFDTGEFAHQNETIIA